LLPAWRDVVDDPPRYDEMGARVVVAEDEIGSQEDDPRSEAGSRHGRREDAGYNHDAPQDTPAE
jgi:hypothetical protein